MLVRQVELVSRLCGFLSVSGMSADIYIYQSFLILHIDAIALCWFARLNPWLVPTGRLCGWNVGGWVCAGVGTSSANLPGFRITVRVWAETSLFRNELLNQSTF